MRAFGRSVFLAVLLMVATAVSVSQAQVDKVDLNAELSVRLNRTTPTDLAAANRNGDRVAAELQNRVSQMQAELKIGRIDAASRTMNSIFAAIPQDERAFGYIMSATNARTVVLALRKTIGVIGRMVPNYPSLRTQYLTFITEMFERNMVHAKTNPRYLEMFASWANPVMEWRYYYNSTGVQPESRKAYLATQSPTELQMIQRYDAAYNVALHAMTPAQRLAAYKTEAPITAFVPKTCRGIFHPGR